MNAQGSTNMDFNNVSALHQQAPRGTQQQYIDYYTQAGQPVIPPTQGEKNTISHPYMYIERFDIRDSDYNKKFQVRNTISLDEYINSYMKMLTATNPHFPVVGALKFHLEHIKQLTQATQSKPWEVVRFWSLCHFEAIEKGSLTWEDENKIQMERH